jgi:hypothetical protein
MSSDGLKFFDFIGIGWREMEGYQPQVYALCIQREDDQSNVYERPGVTHTKKEAWDKVAEFDENIILG